MSRYPVMCRFTAAAALWLVCFPPAALTYVTDLETYIPIDYSTFLPPDRGGTYIDPAFGTPIKRISDAMRMPNAAGAGYLTRITHEYSTISPFNSDNSRFVVGHQSYWALYDGAGQYLRDLPFEIREPRWSRTDPNLLYYVTYANQLKQYDVGAGVSSIVRTFAEYSTVTGRGESDISADGDHFVLVGDYRDIFVYEISSDRKGPVLDTTLLGPFDNVHITPSNDVLVSWYATGSARYQGVERYDAEMRFRHQVALANGHLDVTRNIAGDDVVIYIGEGAPPCAGVVSINLSDLDRVCLLSFDWTLAAHVSVPDNASWTIITTYALADVSPTNRWARYTNEILQVPLDGGEVRRLAHHRSRSFNSYTWTPRPAVSRDGNRLLFDSNFGLQSILGHPAEYSDVYLVDLSELSVSPPGSTKTLRTRYEQDDLSVAYSGTWLTSAHPLHSAGSARLSMEAGARATFSFFGTAVRWIGYGDEWSGIANVYIDRELEATVDTWMSPARTQVVLFSIIGLPLALHTVEVEATGTANLASSGRWIWIDAFDVGRRFEQDHPATTYTGTWLTETHSAHSWGSAARANEAGARAVFTFDGAAVSWIGCRKRSTGIAGVHIDGALRAEIDTYASTSAHNVLIYTLSGLSNGRHTLAIEVTGRRNPAASGAGICVDGFEIAP